MPRRPCLVCGALADGSYCAAHVPQRGSRSWRSGSSRSWRGLRARALLRDGDRCVRCGTRNRLEVHHVVPLADGGSMALDNLTVLCEGCHGHAHRPTAA